METREEGGWAVFQEPRSSMLHALIATAICVAPIYFNVAMLSIVAFLSPQSAFLVGGLLIFMTIFPIKDNSKLGQKLSRYVCKHVCGYFPVTLHVEDLNSFNPYQAYVFGLEPHSVFPIGVFALASQKGFLPLPKMKFLASSAIFYIPMLRHVWAWLGLAPASKKNFSSLLAAGYSCIIVPGGTQESFYMEPRSEVAFLKARKGFVRVAMEMGRPLVPVFCFGQTSVYKWWKPSGRLYIRISRAIKFTPMVFWGMIGSPLPYQNPIHVMVGRPIDLKKNPQPTMEEVDEVHGKFIEAIQDLFQRNKARIGHPDLQLRIL